MKYSKIKYASFLMAAGLVAANATAAPQPHRNVSLAENSPQPTVSKGVYIIQMKDQTAIQRSVDLRNVPERMLAKAGANYNPNSSENQSYVAQLKSKQHAVIASSSLPAPIYTYGHTFNGFTVKISEQQAEVLRNHPDVLNVWKDEFMPLTTANTPEFMELTTPGGLHDTGALGEDVIVGIVDTGINPTHPSFDGTDYAPMPEGSWNGECAVDTDVAFECNNKLIGARYFNAGAKAAGTLAGYEVESPRDVDGHGSHVAGTAAGNVLESAMINGQDAGETRGMAPRARVAAYKACWDFSDRDPGCFGTDTMAAIEAAVEDGVDVINYSIGGSLTSLLTGPSFAFLNATNAGVFVATSAGNSGPSAGTVGMPVPWVTNVAASTYDGQTPAQGISVTTGAMAGSTLLANEAAFTPTLASTGPVSAELAVTIDDVACAPLSNPADVAGKIALISRGGCAFTTKVENAQNAGAIAAVVYNNLPGAGPFPMGGTPANPITIPAVMIGNDDGVAIAAEINGGGSVSVTLSDTITATATEVGNIMADFSSRGPSLAVADLMVPDITAPGVKILAASPVAEEFAYLQGTSMASPHIAGIAALVIEQNPGWSPAAVRSAIMTTARQNVVKEDGVTPADPFDFGAGHVVPNAAVNPGIVYEAGLADYVGFICGKEDEVAVVESIYGAGICASLADGGYPSGTNYNHPSITASELGFPEAAVRIVTDVSGADSTYTATIEAPAGIDVTLNVWNGSSFEPASTMNVTAGGIGAYQLVLSQNASVVLDDWVFGSITWTNGTHTVRSPIAVLPVIPPKANYVESVIDAPTSDRHRMTLPVEFNYNGSFFAEAVGMTAGIKQPNVVSQDPDSSFSFNEPGLGLHFFESFEGTRALRFSLRTDELPNPSADIDLFVYGCDAEDGCSLVGQSTNGSSDEDVMLMNPAPLNGSDFYLAFVHGWSLAGDETMAYNLNIHAVNGNEGNMLVRTRPIARAGFNSNIYLYFKDLLEGETYLGGVVLTDDSGEEIGFTLVELNR
ncbi:S8 family serine peptidase [Thalassotalea euphylliae]|uniref:S8 family serine peptidase n=1 Tax=Thalassotalea euphylliae TaxID=1655234 RepID=UPI00362A5FF6